MRTVERARTCRDEIALCRSAGETSVARQPNILVQIALCFIFTLVGPIVSAAQQTSRTILALMPRICRGYGVDSR